MSTFLLTKAEKSGIVTVQNKNDNFTYDPEAEENSKGTRLPFGLCKFYMDVDFCNKIMRES